MKQSSLAKLKLWLSRDTAWSGHPTDEEFFYNFLMQYIEDRGNELDESELEDLIISHNNFPISRELDLSEPFQYSLAYLSVKRFVSTAKSIVDYVHFMKKSRRGL